MKAGLIGALVGLVLAVGLGGCGEDESLGSACSNMVSCGMFASDSECQLQMGAFVLSNACLKSINKSSCDDLTGNQPSYLAVCWDQCSGDSQHCAGDTIQMCIGGWEYIGDCEGVCLANGGSYVGTCADEYNGQTSDSGLDVCWCG